MVSRVHISFKATERSYLALLKREIHSLAYNAGFSEKKVGEIDIIVSELGTNLVNHGGGGQILVKLIEEHNIQGIELIAIDKGEGMTDVARMMVDGVSSKKTLGQGLGAMKRLSDFFQVYSQKNWGTVLVSRVFNEELPHFRKKDALDIKSLILPKPLEQKCGDGFYSAIRNDKAVIFLGDGLGHGPNAEAAVLAAIDALDNTNETDPVSLIRHMHAAVKKTRGLVGTVATFDLKAKKWSICGVGNILTRINSHGTQNGYMPYNGIIGMNIPNSLKERDFDFESGQYILMCSDGIKSRLDFSKHPAIHRYDGTIMSAMILNEFARYTDDMSVAVCKINL